jgi:hypothetical protein
MINLFKYSNAIIPTDTWRVGKESTAMFELATWHASFPDFFHHSPTLLLGNNYCFQMKESGFAE